MKRKKFLKRVLYTLLFVFVFLNVVAALHAWRFTHFTTGKEARNENPGGMSFGKKLLIALTGVPNPRPSDNVLPSVPYENVTLQSNVRISCWYLPVSPSKGTALLFHGYGGSRSSMLSKAYIFREAGYNVLLPDLMGAGASEGNQVTIGYKEAENVKTCYDYVKQKGEQRIIMAGSSMGAAAILKYVQDHPQAQPAGVIIECPFGTMYETVCIRFKMVHAPVFPMAGLLVFWGGLENGFYAFDHNPADYAKAVKCPALLLFGEKDDRVTRKEIDDVFRNLGGPKQLMTFPLAGHNNYLQRYRQQWTDTVIAFLDHL